MFSCSVSYKENHIVKLVLFDIGTENKSILIVLIMLKFLITSRTELLIATVRSYLYIYIDT